MKREIKFRAWDTVKKEWFPKMWSVDPITGNPHYLHPIDEGYLYLSKEPANHYVAISQYTGIEDRCGKSIYEGDILSFWDRSAIVNIERIGEVKFDPQRAGYYIPFKREGKNYYRDFNISYGDGETYRDESIEVVGNIYENPEFILQP